MSNKAGWERRSFGGELVCALQDISALIRKGSSEIKCAGMVPALFLITIQSVFLPSPPALVRVQREQSSQKARQRSTGKKGSRGSEHASKSCDKMNYEIVHPVKLSGFQIFSEVVAGGLTTQLTG